MGSLSADKAGIGSAVNDTTRELCETLGVAIIGSIFSSVYIDALGDGSTVRALPPEAHASARCSPVVSSRLVPEDSYSAKSASSRSMFAPDALSEEWTRQRAVRA
jgi:hypothetical protein